MQTIVSPAAIAQNPLKAAYQTLQWGKNAFGLAHKETATRVRGFLYPETQVVAAQPSPVMNYVRQRFQSLLDQDWADAEAGVYPISLLFENPWEDFFRYYPAVCLDLPQLWQRAQQKRYQEFAPDIETENYPAYYVQNFHHQTDGYLSDTSANLYDLQVELLFGGTTEPMRRRILPLLKDGLVEGTKITDRSFKLLDVACGTGRTLWQLRSAFAKTSLFGMDLSPAYLRKANQILSQRGELPQLLQANAEEMPYQNNYFHAVTSVFLFHELPAIARQQVIEECFRVLRPGGTLVICDSIQLSDSAELAPIMKGFSKTFHEPYYNHYIQDDLTVRLEQAGFKVTACETHFMSKYLAAQKM
jgi:ubiquinone/menaquinone biosynthesis C-methylase UbiE